MFDPKVYYDRNATNPRFFVVALQVAGRDNTTTADDVSRIWVAVSRSPEPGQSGADELVPLQHRRPQERRHHPGQLVRLPGYRCRSGQLLLRDEPVPVHRPCLHLRRGPRVEQDDRGEQRHLVPDRAQVHLPAVGHCGRLQPVHDPAGPALHQPVLVHRHHQPGLLPEHPARNQHRVPGLPGPERGGRVADDGAAHAHRRQLRHPAQLAAAGQRGDLVDTGDNRMLQVAGIGNRLQGIFTTVCNFTTGTANESCTRAPAVTVGQSPGPAG